MFRRVGSTEAATSALAAAAALRFNPHSAAGATRIVEDVCARLAVDFEKVRVEAAALGALLPDDNHGPRLEVVR